MREFPNEQRVPIHVEHGDGRATLDGTLFPIIPCRWAGEMSQGLFDKFWAAREPFEGFVSTVILVHDINDINPMKPTIRKALSDKAQNDPKIQAGFFFSIVVVSNPLIRGTLTAVSWMAGDKFPMDFVANLRDGLKRGVVLQERKDIAVPPLPPDYEFPPHPADK